MSDPTITCPNCNTEIKLTESLAAPLIETIKRDFEKKIAKKDAEFARREKTLQENEQTLTKAKETQDAQIAEKLKLEREKIMEEALQKAKLALSNDLEQKSKELTALQGVIKQQDEKLAEAQKTQVEYLQKQRELEDAKRELDLTVEKRIQEGLVATRDHAKKEAEEALKFKVMEKEQTIASMQKQIDELKRRSEQGSQQLQGEVQELELEALLKAKFPHDEILPIPKGEHGGDLVQSVVSPLGQQSGSILWESKRTKNWSDSWLTKLRDDQRTAKAEIAVIVSQALPKEVDSFELIDGVWVVHPKFILPVAFMLRHSLIEVALARQASEGQQTKMEMVYQYLMGPRFRQRVEALAEAFSTMQDDLNKERKVMTKQWAKREEQIDRVMQATVGMYGDLQGIAGKSLQEIEGLELQALEAPKDEEDERVGKLFE